MQDPIFVELLGQYPKMDDDELEKKYTFIISSKKYAQLKLKKANSGWTTNSDCSLE